MKKRERFIFSMLVMLCLTLPFSMISVFAFNAYDHRFADGTCTGKYAINANVTTAPCGTSYTTLIKAGVTNWNNAGAGVSFTYTTGSSYKIYFTVGNFGNSGNVAQTQFFNSSGRNLGNDVGRPRADYAYTIVSLNNTIFSNYSSTLGSATGVKAITAHEMGHSLGLGHCSANPSNIPLMVETIAAEIIDGKVTYCVPQIDDILGVKSIY